MKRAVSSEKSIVVDILSEAFDQNQSVNYVIDSSSRRRERIQGLMDYSFKVCNAFGDVWISEDKKACALILLPDRKTFSLASAWWDIQLASRVIGLTRVSRTLKREATIKKFHPENSFAYLWFIGVRNISQNNGIGSSMLQEIIATYDLDNRPIYLETSVNRNLPWYLKNGFEIYNTVDFGYPLTFLRTHLQKQN